MSYFSVIYLYSVNTVNSFLVFFSLQRQSHNECKSTSFQHLKWFCIC